MRSRIVVRVERVGLATRPVQRQHQVTSRTLAVRVHRDVRLERRDQLGISPEREVRLGSLLVGDEAELVEPSSLGANSRLVSQVGERWPAPEREREPSSSERAATTSTLFASSSSRSKRTASIDARSTSSA